MGPREFRTGLAVALGVALLARLLVIFSPLGEIDGDEAVVGLMARHIAFLGERPVFYWGQPYLGSLEAFTAAPLFLLFGSSTVLLKLVPTVYSLAFLGTTAFMARRLFGASAALATAAYLALPPAMWAVWSTKARGGYAELLFLGQALLLVTMWLAARCSWTVALLWGFLAGLSFWTHLLAIVYLLPAVVFVLLRRRTTWSAKELSAIAAGVVVGLSPMIIDNISNGFLTVAALLQPSDIPPDLPAQFLRFFRVGIPVLLGLGQPTTSEMLFDLDWLNRPAGHLSVVVLALIVLGGVVVWHARALPRLIACRADQASEPGLLVLLALAVPPAIAATRFGFFVSEPRYALPLYGTVPLLMGALWSLAPRLPRIEVLRWLAVGALLAFNLWSLLSTDLRLWRPEDAPDSTSATRADLVSSLVSQDRHQIYTDYWIAYPVMFDTRETVQASVISGGFNRYLPPADNVQRTPNPAWVFTPDSLAENLFLTQLQAAGGQAHKAEVAVYDVYTDVQPLENLRPGR